MACISSHKTLRQPQGQRTRDGLVCIVAEASRCHTRRTYSSSTLDPCACWRERAPATPAAQMPTPPPFCSYQATERQLPQMPHLLQRRHRSVGVRIRVESGRCRISLNATAHNECAWWWEGAAGTAAARASLPTHISSPCI